MCRIESATYGQNPSSLNTAARLGCALVLIASLGALVGGVVGELPFAAIPLGGGLGFLSSLAFVALSLRPPRAAPDELLVSFYTANGKDSEGRTLEEILAWDDSRLESCHNYIQWLFPTPHRSRFNSKAPCLTAAHIAALGGHANIRRAYQRIKAFYGNFDPLPPSHNFLRITRILTALRCLGFEAEAEEFWGLLQPLRSKVSAETFSMWERAATR